MRVLVVGLLERQQQVLSKRYPGIRFRFMRAGCPSKSIAGAEHIFLMLRFINHGCFDLVRTFYDKKRVHRIMGSLTQLYQKMDEVLCENYHQRVT